MILTSKFLYRHGPGGLRFRKVVVSSSSLLGLFLLAAAIAGCSDSGSADSKEKANDSSLADSAAIARLAQPLAEWAASAAAEYGKQVDAEGQPDFTAAARAIAPATQALTAELCKSFRDKNALRDPEKASELEKQVAFAADEALARALAHKPPLLAALGMATWGRWPPFVLKDPAPAPDMPVGDLSQGLSEFVKPEFIGADGGLALPGQGAPSYQDFQRWFYDPSLDNPLLEQAIATTQSFSGWTDACSK